MLILSAITLKVLILRTVHEQLVRLLSVQERQQLRTSEAFLPFSGLNPLHHNPYTQPLWKAAVAQYEKGMAPAEQRIAGKLRQQFRDLAAQSHQVNSTNYIWAQLLIVCKKTHAHKSYAYTYITWLLIDDYRTLGTSMFTTVSEKLLFIFHHIFQEGSFTKVKMPFVKI